VEESNLPRFSIRNYVRTLLFGYAVASVVVFLTNLDRTSSFAKLAVFVLVIGFVINSSIWGVSIAFRPLFRRVPEKRHVAVYGVATLLAGAIGFPVGYSLSVLIVAGRFPSLASFREPFAITLGISLLAGIAMHAYLQIEQRLMASMERLRVHELAEKELELARSIQQRLLPPSSMRGEGWEIEARIVPARFVAGDFYDAFTMNDARLALFVGDVSGKGIGASLIMASVKSVLPLLARSGEVDRTMTALHEKLAGELGPREFVAVAHAVFDPSTGSLVLANAALPDPYLVRSSGEITPLVVTGNRLPLGVPSASHGRDVLSLTLDRGDAILFFTDGLPETPDPSGDPMGYARLDAKLSELAARRMLSPAGILSSLSHTSPDDDITLLMLRRT
jgi:serine phosphatase RsbU (regulator of sigma subunit)